MKKTSKQERADLSDTTTPTTNATAPTTTTSKPKRVRTGCLTCRERHLKCDEAQPICLNCDKSSRECKRGLRLNFIDTKLMTIPVTIAPGADWAVKFVDESRETQEKYVGRPYRYPPLEQSLTPQQERLREPIRQSLADAHDASHNGFLSRNNQLPPMLFSGTPDVHVNAVAMSMDMPPLADTLMKPQSTQEQSHPRPQHQLRPYGSVSHENGVAPSNKVREYLKSPEEVLFMQIFVEEVGIWMDSMDSMKHFSRLLPFYALDVPMLLNAFFACGARHLTLVNSAYSENKALHYYDTATTQLLTALRNPDRDIVVCASCAVILNVYEVMSERAMQRMNHIAGARALIKECGWNAKSTGIGGACFWLNIGMELLSCLHFSWQVAWDPDQWGLDPNWGHVREEQHGQEELWVHRIVYVTAKIANFRASIPRFQDADEQRQRERTMRRMQEWNELKELCDAWNHCIPSTMHPMACLLPQQTANKSPFPEIWLIGRATRMGRLFYHAALTLLASINPARPISQAEEMQTMQLHHAQQICGIVAHVKDRGVASAAIRILAIAADVLVDRVEQEAVLKVFDKIQAETGWQIGFLYFELKEKWGWTTASTASPLSTSGMSTGSISGQNNPFSTPSSSVHGSMTGSLGTNLPMPPPLQGQTRPPKPPKGISHPIYSKADFNLPEHPYQDDYTPPSQNTIRNMWT